MSATDPGQRPRHGRHCLSCLCSMRRRTRSGLAPVVVLLVTLLFLLTFPLSESIVADWARRGVRYRGGEGGGLEGGTESGIGETAGEGRIGGVGGQGGIGHGGIGGDTRESLSFLAASSTHNDSPPTAAQRAKDLETALQYAGSGARVDQFLQKAARGEAVTVAVVGGSVSKGRGLVHPSEPHYDPTPQLDHPLGAPTLYSPENMHVRVFEWLNATFPNPRHRLVNGAQGGVGAAYFAGCFQEHIPPDADLVIVELSINDVDVHAAQPQYDLLIRRLLQLESHAAVINFETFTTLFSDSPSNQPLASPWTSTPRSYPPGRLHPHVSSPHGKIWARYDIPSLTIRDVLLPLIEADPEAEYPKWFRVVKNFKAQDAKVKMYGGVPVDMLHMSARGHALGARLIIDYLQHQLSTLPATSPKASKPKGGVFGVKKLRLGLPAILGLNLGPSPESRTPTPVCRSMNSPHLHNHVSGTDGMPEFQDAEQVQGLALHESSHGWAPWSWKEKHYLVGREGALAVFEFFIAGDGEGEEELPVLRDSPSGGEADSDADNSQHPNGLLRWLQRPGHRLGSDKAARDFTAIPASHTPNLGVFTRALKPRGAKGSKPKTPNPGPSISIAYQRSAHYALTSAFCWVDEDRAAGKQFDGYWDVLERNMGVVEVVASGLARGPHRLSCEVLGGKSKAGETKSGEFRLFGIVHD